MKKTITVSDGAMKTCHGVAKNIQITVGGLRAEIEFLFVDRVPVGVLIGIPETEDPNTCIDLGGQHVYLTIGRRSAQIDL